jgi:signal transduction histidine kinase
VRIESITADARTFDPASGKPVPAGTAHVQTTFTALTLADPTRVRFRYRLEGFDRDWVDAGTARQASYTNLSPREYRFRVEASNGDGIWGGAGATMDFTVEPMFYQTRWFYAACVAAAGLIVGGVWRLRVRRVRRQFALVLAERIRMSRAIHDTLLQGLAGLALQVDDLSHNIDGSPTLAKARVLRIRQQVEEYIREARQSIWDLRSPRLEGHDLAHALREAGARAVADRAVYLDFDVTGSTHRCTPSTDEQLLLIGQEALNNAVLHGRATRVKVALDYGAERTRLSVSDDGCGFDPLAAPPADGHCGLSSMRERAEFARGHVRIESAPGRGTYVEAVVPTV